jgi:tetratricopeptide (TPR) repeat protein
MMSWHWFIASALIALLLPGCSGAKSVKDIAKQVQSSIVLIGYEDQPGHGSGFFVTGHKEVCTVLTARHVIPPNGKLQLQTPDQKLWKAANVQRFSNQDLALVTFEPDSQDCPYPALKLGNSGQVTVGNRIYISGFPSRAGAGKLVGQFVPGDVTAIDDLPEGYGISYQATTAGGMSGGPGVNTDGDVIAIHGRSDTEVARLAELKGTQLPQQQQSAAGANSTEMGAQVGTFKWGIPINTYVANVPKMPTEAAAEPTAPKTAKDWVSVGNDLSVSKNYEEAINAYDKALEIKPDSSEAWYNRGIALRNLQRYEDAIASYDKAIQFQPDYANAWNNRGIALEKLQRYEDAIASYDKAIQFQPGDADPWYNRGIALEKLQRYEDAIASYGKAIQFQPGDADAWYNRGIALEKLQRYEDAIASYDKAIQFKPNYADAWNNRGYALQKLQRYDDALESYDKAIKFDPNYQRAINNRKQLLTWLRRSR